MANASRSTKLALWIFLLITIHGNALSLPFVEVILHRGTLKTLQVIIYIDSSIAFLFFHLIFCLVYYMTNFLKVQRLQTLADWRWRRHWLCWYLPAACFWSSTAQKSHNTGFLFKVFFSLQVIYVIFSIRNFLTGGLNVILKMKPSSYPSGIKADDSQAKLFQPWHGHGKCPEGTIPIFRRTQKHDHHHHSVPLNPSATPRNHSFLEGVSYSEVLFQL